jgi:hypothetical protein
MLSVPSLRLGAHLADLPNCHGLASQTVQLADANGPPHDRHWLT